MANDFDDEISQDDLDALIQRAEVAESQNVKLSNALAMSGATGKDKNFLHLQVETGELLEKLEHFYRGDKKVRYADMSADWIENDNKELVTFNEFGVTSMMGIVTKYIDKGTILSNYPEERIYEIIADIGEELILFILCNYKQMGMDTYYKKTQFRLIITTTAHMIENAYRRALKGKTLEELNQSRIVGQFGDPSKQPIINPNKPRGGLRGLFGMN